MYRWFRRRKKYSDIAPDEIFLDSRNLPGLDTHQFEGRIERPIGHRTIFLLAIIFTLVGVGFLVRTWRLQIVEGSEYFTVSENNRLDRSILFAERGVIYDRNNFVLAENAVSPDSHAFPLRVYAGVAGLAHVLGYLDYPKADRAGNYFQETASGQDGVERYYNTLLMGTNGARIIETDARGDALSESTIDPPRNGEDLRLSIDARVQEKMYESMHALAEDVGFVGGGSVILDVHTGEILSLVSYPEFNSQVLTDKVDNDAVTSVLHDNRNPFLNRVTSGLYTPGSVIKPFVAAGALDRHIINPEKEIYSAGHIDIPNPYNPSQVTVFNDWKAHGWVDMRHALAVSSNVYFFSIGGGYEDQRGIGISGIEEYAQMFGIGELTKIDLPDEVVGTIPSPKWKERTFPEDPTWRIGDTYNTSIGQYGFQVTPLQMARAVAAIANGGLLISPHVRIDSEAVPVRTVPIAGEDLQLIREGMREAVLSGTAKGLNASYVDIAAKTGTAELGVVKDNVNSWVIGFFPYDAPRYAFATVMERGPATNLVGSLYVMRQVFDWMAVNAPEYFEDRIGDR